MALNPKCCVLVRNAALDSLTSNVGASGLMRWYDGAQPTDPDTALSSNTLGPSLTLSATMAPASSAGSMTLNAIGSAASAAVLNPCTWGSLLTSGAVRKFDFSIGTSGANLNLNSTTIGSGATCSCTSFVISMAA